LREIVVVEKAALTYQFVENLLLLLVGARSDGIPKFGQGEVVDGVHISHSMCDRRESCKFRLDCYEDDVRAAASPDPPYSSWNIRSA
jgi:hypothetical protein